MERNAPWEPRKGNILGASVTSNLVKLIEQESKLDFLFGGSWEGILVDLCQGLRRDCLSGLLEDRQECLWLLPRALQKRNIISVQTAHSPVTGILPAMSESDSVRTEFPQIEQMLCHVTSSH